MSRAYFKRSILLAGATAWIVGCSPAPPTAPAATAPTLPLIIAHRGASGHAPENTLAAFRLAWKQGADGIEGDFHLTRDGRIICLHDADTRRTAPDGPPMTVRSSTFDELRTQDVGVWRGEAFRGERIPTLAEVMAVVPSGKRFFLEVKCGPEIVEPLLDALENGPLGKDQVTVISFNDTVITQFKSVAPEWRASWLVDIEPNAGGAPQPPSISLIEALGRLPAEAVGLQADESLDARYFAALKAAGFERHVWTLNSPGAARRFVAFGVDSLTTDVPGALREALVTGVD